MTHRRGNTELKSYHGSGNGQGDIWKIGETFLIDLLRCSVLWFSAINQNPLSCGGLKKVSRKSCDIQSHSQRRCELKSADSRAVTKRGLFDCEPAHTADRMVQCDKTTCAQWAKEAKCNIQNCFHLWGMLRCPYRKPTQVDEERILRPTGEGLSRNSAS